MLTVHKHFDLAPIESRLFDLLNPGYLTY